MKLQLLEAVRQPKDGHKFSANICQKPVCIYTGQETVTHALFAYGCKALDDERTFEEALLQTFESLEWIQPDPEFKRNLF